MKSLLRSWLGVETQPQHADRDTLRQVLDALDALEPARARYLARFAYLLGRVAHADQHVSPEETRAMETIIEQEGGLAVEQTMLVVSLAKHSSLLFGGTDNFLVAREFAVDATHEQKLQLLRCLFAVSIAEGSISIAEEREIQRIASELRVETQDLVALRLEHRAHLPGLSVPIRSEGTP
jgi:uncharacterized tellurite resistance protein B-like protein